MITKIHDSVDIAALDTHLISIQAERKNSLTRPEDEDSIFLCEPLETYSMGFIKDVFFIKDAQTFHAYRQEKNIPFIFLRRGGGIFWHGKGQLCIAPVTDIRRLGLNMADYTKLLEDLCIDTLKEFRIKGFRHEYENKKTGKKQYGTQGVWVLDPASSKIKKIAFLGWSDRGGIAIHGCAINISCTLFPFSLIHPCNLEEVEATSIEAIRGDTPLLKDVSKAAAYIWKEKIETLRRKIK